MEVQRPDPTARLAALLAIGAAGLLVLLAGAFSAVYPEIPTSIENALIEFFVASPNLIPVAVTIGVLPIILVAIYFFSFGNRIARAERFPLPGQKVVRSTRIREGKEALAHARAIQILAVVLITVCCALPFVFVGIVRSVTGAA